MREIKFRAWDYEDKKMWKVVAISASIWGDCEEAHIRICDFDKSPCDEETNVRLSVSYSLMQFTGLKDKNGREIYEGDVVLIHQWNRKYEVIFESGMFKVKGNTRFSLCTTTNGELTCEVIGNIYENPELLKEVNA